MSVLILKRALFGLLMVVSFVSEAQKVDTVWFNKKWTETVLPQEYHYLRTIKQVDSINSRYEIIDHFPDGKVQMKGYYSSIKPEVKNGEFLYYTEEGGLTTKNIWVDNLVAETFAYDITGKQTHHVIKREYLATLSAREKFERYGIKEIDSQPAFPGGEDAFSAFLSKNLVYPPDAVSQNIQGSVVVAATIDASGKLRNVRLYNQVHPLLDEEALRVAELIPKKKWTPAQDKGKPVSADFLFPVVFKLK